MKMKKIFLIFFLTIFLGSLFLPLISLAGTYQTYLCPEGHILTSGKCCPEDHPYYTHIGEDLCCMEVGTTDEGDRFCTRIGEPQPINPTVHTITYDGLVPCGKEVDVNSDRQVVHCQFCHFFVMFDGIVKFVLFNLVPPIAVLMMVIAGVMFFAAADNPENINKAKSLFKSVVIGLILIYGAWVLINLFFLTIGVADWTELIPKKGEGWFIINCPIDLDAPITPPAPACPTTGCVFKLLPNGGCFPPDPPNLIVVPGLEGFCCCPAEVAPTPPDDDTIPPEPGPEPPPEIELLTLRADGLKANYTYNIYFLDDEFREYSTTFPSDSEGTLTYNFRVAEVGTFEVQIIDSETWEIEKTLEFTATQIPTNIPCNDICPMQSEGLCAGEGTCVLTGAEWRCECIMFRDD